MPTYTFLNTDTNESYDIVLKMSELDAYKLAHPTHSIQIGTAAPIADPVRLGFIKPPEGFRDVLRKIADNTAGGKGLRDRIR
jgi:hypothetical protein